MVNQEKQKEIKNDNIKWAPIFAISVFFILILCVFFAPPQYVGSELPQQTFGNDTVTLRDMCLTLEDGETKIFISNETMKKLQICNGTNVIN